MKGASWHSNFSPNVESQPQFLNPFIVQAPTQLIIYASRCRQPCVVILNIKASLFDKQTLQVRRQMEILKQTWEVEDEGEQEPVMGRSREYNCWSLSEHDLCWSIDDIHNAAVTISVC